MALEPMQGKWASSRVDVQYTEIFCVPVVTPVSFETCDSVLGVSLEFLQANQGSSRVSWGGQNCSACNAGESGVLSWQGEFSWFFLSCGGNLGYIHKLREGWPYKTRVFSPISGLLSSYAGHLRNLHKAWQGNMVASRGEAEEPVSLSRCHSDIGIPIKFQEESGIVTF